MTSAGHSYSAFSIYCKQMLAFLTPVNAAWGRDAADARGRRLFVWSKFDGYLWLIKTFTHISKHSVASYKLYVFIKRMFYVFPHRVHRDIHKLSPVNICISTQKQLVARKCFYSCESIIKKTKQNNADIFMMQSEQIISN